MSSPNKASLQTRPQATDNELREKMQRLSLCHGKLSPEDAELLEEVFPGLMRAYSKPVWKYLRKRRVRTHDAKDLLQETFVLLYEHLLDEGFPDDMMALLTSMADGKVRNYVRGQLRAPISYTMPSSKSEQPTSGLDIDRALDLRRLRDTTMPQLSPEHRDVIEKLVLHGLSYRDAAEMLNIPDGTLRSRLMAAKRTLAELAEKFLPQSQRGPR